ncbi:hypothetical protein ACFQZ4_02840 [Catellatospora coxensis]
MLRQWSRAATRLPCACAGAPLTCRAYAPVSPGPAWLGRRPAVMPLRRPSSGRESSSTACTAPSRLRRPTSSLWVYAGSRTHSSMGTSTACSSGRLASAWASSALTSASRSCRKALSPVGMFMSPPGQVTTS